MAILIQRHRARDGVEFPIYVHLPGHRGRDWDRSTAIVHLHGGMERGADPERLLSTGLCARWRRGLPVRSAVLVPQCPTARTWIDLRFALAELVDRHPMLQALAPRHVALTGVSMGGAGAWVLGSDRPDHFGAVAPICAPMPDLAGFPARVRRLVGTRVLAIHGARDPVVPPQANAHLVDVLRRAGGDARFALHEAAGHAVWEAAYDDPSFWEFLTGPARGRSRAP